jgi:multicomponent Na+:H+ antiporter subunit B
MLYIISFLPRFGDSSQNPTLNEIVDKYIQDGINDTGAINFVTGMILDYRAFDTLGESFVLFTAVNCVLIMLQGYKDKKEKEEIYQTSKDKIVKYSCSFIIPVILLFGAYVILNGSISPGGGFSGGAIMGSGLILYALAFGFEKSGLFFKQKTFKVISSCSLLTYCACKTYSFYTGYNEIESIVPNGIPGAILSGGIIFILNVCVGLVVTCTIFGFYSLFKKGEI